MDCAEEPKGNSGRDVLTARERYEEDPFSLVPPHHHILSTFIDHVEEVDFLQKFTMCLQHLFTSRLDASALTKRR
jgi:hypothetical protein